MKLPKHVNGFLDRHGRQRYYLRVKGKKLVSLPGLPWSPEMMATIEAARLGKLPKRQPRPGQYVYFLIYNTRIKIGTSTNVQARLKSLATGIPGKVRIYYVTPGDKVLENHLHRLFAADRVSGEWFMFSTAIKDWIKADEERRATERQWVRHERRTEKAKNLTHSSRPTFAKGTQDPDNTQHYLGPYPQGQDI